MPPPTGSNTATPTPPPTVLDPLGSLIYYLCVSEAIHDGVFIAPSSQKIAKELKLEGGKSGMPVNPLIRELWNDLSRMNQTRLLLNETAHRDSEYFLGLAQHNVNRRMQRFRPGFVPASPGAKQRHMDTREFVERPKTAIRLTAMKDMYFYAGRDLPQKLLLGFLKSEALISDEDDFYTFLESMSVVRYVDLDPLTEPISERDRNRPFVIEPGPVFRAQDMYLELRSLDFFGKPPSTDRWSRRLDMRRRAEQFASKASAAAI